jgi:hypothetical protein
MRGQVLFNTPDIVLWNRAAGLIFKRSMARSLPARSSGTADSSELDWRSASLAARNWQLSSLSVNSRFTGKFAKVYPWLAYRA